MPPITSLTPYYPEVISLSVSSVQPDLEEGKTCGERGAWWVVGHGEIIIAGNHAKFTLRRLHEHARRSIGVQSNPLSLNKRFHREPPRTATKWRELKKPWKGGEASKKKKKKKSKWKNHAEKHATQAVHDTVAWKNLRSE